MVLACDRISQLQPLVQRLNLRPVALSACHHCAHWLTLSSDVDVSALEATSAAADRTLLNHHPADATPRCCTVPQIALHFHGSVTLDTSCHRSLRVAILRCHPFRLSPGQTTQVQLPVAAVRTPPATMHRLRNKKKVQQEIASPRPSQDSESSGWFKKGKKPQEEQPKPDLDLNSALPSNDDFRTSLLMTGLSARFSMLREQDNPSTKIGKAHDDSVLMPRRRSQDINGALGALTGLSDIAEVESLRAPFLKPDYSSDADSTHGSVMSRSKPTEGNNLFGGRQKIYKIPAGKEGGIGGKALYDDDVAMSAFQRWRLEERRRRSFEGKEDENEADMEDQEPRPESPFSTAYQRKRETTSTTSSIPSMARFSTAATSVTSQQPTPSITETSSVSTAPTSANSTPVLDRNFTRSRRLYETGLNNELHEQQSSALSRIDTLTRQRNPGSRTPDPNQGSTSPTNGGFVDRLFGSERRVLAKGSAPNLRSASPSTLRSGAGTPDLGVRVPSALDRRDYGGAPPLSPPISESEEISSLAIGPNDLGKATALGVFQKPSQGYDESRFAQRQLQLQQGRDTSTQRSRAESNGSLGLGGRSSSSSSHQQSQLQLKVEMPLDQTAEETASPTFFDDSEASSIIPPGEPTPVSLDPRDGPLAYGRPGSRDSAMPTPLSFASGGASPTYPSAMLAPNTATSPADSPTLGPGVVSGLSGMVRQHLRADSGASSIYGITSATTDLAPRSADGAMEGYDVDSLEKPASGARTSFYDDDEDDEVTPEGGSSSGLAPAPGQGLEQRKSRGAEEFANQLADGARRVRERLTFYVEADNAQSAPSLPLQGTQETPSAQSTRSTGLGLLRPKSSLGSLMDRTREPKSKKTMGFNDGGAEDSAVLPTMKETPDEAPENDEDGEEQHAGIRAFRQARRELQRMKENEQQQPDLPSSRGTPTKQRPSRPSSPARDRRPPPSMYSRRPSQDSAPGSIRSVSTVSVNADHDRHGSQSSRERDVSGPPPLRRMRNDSSPSGRPGQGDDGRPMVRSPGLPGTNVRGSPILPPQARNRGNPDGNMLRVQAPSNASPHSGSGMPSPGLPSSPRAFLNPQVNTNSDGSEVPGLNDAMKRQVKKKDISEPKFVMSTSRVPTVELPPEAASNRDRSSSRSRSNSRGDGFAPPLPPLNPRRRQDGSKTRTVFGSLSRSKTDVVEEASASAPSIVLPASDKAEGPVTRQLRRMASEAQGMRLNRPMGAPNNPQALVSNIGPPATRMVATNPGDRGSRSSAVLPGGMI